MKILRKLFGLDFPPPAVGQVWRSRHSGSSMRVTGVDTMDTGTLVVSVKTDDIAIGQAYAYGLDQWRYRLRNESRELIEGVPMEPPEPWPRGGNVNPPPRYLKPPAPPSPPQLSPITSHDRADLIATADYLEFDGSMEEADGLRRAALLRRIAGAGGNDGR